MHVRYIFAHFVAAPAKHLPENVLILRISENMSRKR